MRRGVARTRRSSLLLEVLRPEAVPGGVVVGVAGEDGVEDVEAVVQDPSGFRWAQAWEVGISKKL